MTWFTFLSFLQNRLTGKRWDAFHSPYLFRLFSQMCNDQVELENFAAIEAQRTKWLKDHNKLDRQDFGSGSAYHQNQNQVSISDMAKHALSLPFQCRCMSRLVQFEKPATILELGTSLGISAAYLHAGHPSAIITTIEGDPEVAKLAISTFTQLRLTGIQLIVSTFESYLESTASDESKIDILFLDGNHRSAALLHYYEKLKSRFSENTILLVDDIYWSKDMQDGWRKLIHMPEVTQSVNCFQFGVLFFRNEFLEKEHHHIRLPIISIFR
jgi:predicted O-methyltransferase YrrM